MLKGEKSAEAVETAFAWARNSSRIGRRALRSSALVRRPPGPPRLGPNHFCSAAAVHLLDVLDTSWAGRFKYLPEERENCNLRQLNGGDHGCQHDKE